MLNADVPTFDCFLRAEYLYDLKDHHGDLERCTVFGVSSLLGRALGFHVLIHSTGAAIWRLPISALCHKEEAASRRHDDLQLWDCFSYELAVTAFSHLEGRRCMVILKDGTKAEGRYLFTVDWYGSSYAESAGDSGHKCAHIIALDEGNYAAQPNNRILWADPALIEEPFKTIPDYKTNTHEWRCESDTRWVTKGEGKAFYDVLSSNGSEGLGDTGEDCGTIEPPPPMP